MLQVNLRTTLLVNEEPPFCNARITARGFKLANFGRHASLDGDFQFLDKRLSTRKGISGDLFAIFDEGAEVTYDGVTRHFARLVQSSAVRHDTRQGRHDDLVTALR